MLPHLSPGLARAVRTLGQVLIGAGVIVLLFAAYQLWGTGLRHAQAQDRLEAELAELLGEAAAPTPTTAPDQGDDTVTTTGTGTATTTTTPAPPVEPEPGDAVARIEIPAIGVDEVVVHGVSPAELRTGPGHYPTSAGFGEVGNAAIAGHRTTYGQPFHDLDRLEPGDEIRITTIRGTFTYEVDEWFVVGERDVHVLDDQGDARLTLTACHPKYSSRQRIVVSALLVEDPIEPLPRPVTPTPDEAVAFDFGTGLDGDRGQLAGVVTWSGAFLVALAATVAVGRRWRRWPAYLLASPVLVVVLFVAFDHVDRYLPAY